MDELTNFSFSYPLDRRKKFMSPNGIEMFNEYFLRVSNNLQLHETFAMRKKRAQNNTLRRQILNTMSR